VDPAQGIDREAISRAPRIWAAAIFPFGLPRYAFTAGLFTVLSTKTVKKSKTRFLCGHLPPFS
jgi:hypothetical protein